MLLTTFRKNIVRDSVFVTLDPSLEGQIREAKLNSVNTSHINWSTGSECVTNQQKIMYCQCFHNVRCGLGPPPLRSNDGSQNLKIFRACL